MNLVNKINKYLIERYPTIWNTRIVWMLAISTIVHVVFFIFGYFSHTNPVSLQTSRVMEDYFSSGLIMVNIIISMLMLVGWLVMMFKNNGFKNFYPTGSGRLFGQFVCYLLIIFTSITFYFSYMAGFRTYINKAYPNEVLVHNVEVINKAYPFLSLDYQNYKLSNRLYPEVFKNLYCETSADLVDYNGKYYKVRDEIYQFYSVYKVSVTERDEYREFKYPAKEYKAKTPLAYKVVENDTCNYYFKKEVVDVSPYLRTAELSYYNFSRQFYKLDFNEIDFYDRYNNYPYYETSAGEVNAERSYEVNRQVSELLDRKNPAEIKKIMNDFLEISKQYKIRNNLTTDLWFSWVYHPGNFEVKHFVHTNENRDVYAYPPVAYAETAADTVAADAAAVAVAPAEDSRNITYNYYKKNLTNHYYEIDRLKDLLRSVELVKNVDFVSKNIHVYIWIAFFLSALIFSFRVTSLKAVIFTGVTTGILSLLIGLVALLYTMGVAYRQEYFIAYLVLAVGTLILIIPVLFTKAGSKLFTAVLMNMSMNGFVLYVLLILGIISMHQNDDCYAQAGYTYASNCTTILEELDMNTSYLLLAAGLLFLFFYTLIIKKWKALPE